jgi:hypothetical protein
LIGGLGLGLGLFISYVIIQYIYIIY